MVQRKDIKTEDIVELYASGLIGKEVAEKLGCSISLVQQRLKHAGIKMRPSNDRIKVPISKEVLEEMYWDKKMHPGQIGKVFGLHKMTITDKMLEYGIPFRTKSQARIRELNPIFGVGHTKETKEKMSSMFLDGRRKVSLQNQYGNPTKYKGIVYRSSWEAGVAFYFDQHKIKYIYEYKSFPYQDNGRKRSYTPDFYLPRGLNGAAPIFLEVKGIFRERDQEKIQKAMQGDLQTLVLWDWPQLQELGIINSAGKVIIGRELMHKVDPKTGQEQAL